MFNDNSDNVYNIHRLGAVTVTVTFAINIDINIPCMCSEFYPLDIIIFACSSQTIRTGTRTDEAPARKQGDFLAQNSLSRAKSQHLLDQAITPSDHLIISLPPAGGEGFVKKLSI